MEKDRERKKKRKPYGFYVIISILIFVTILTVISFTNPEILIGSYLDNDIRKQLLDVHKSKIESKPDVITTENVEDVIINVRFTFDNDEIVDMRVSRAIEIFNELFEDYERDYTVNELEYETLLELRWVIDKDL